MLAPSMQDMNVAKGVLRYLQGTLDYGLVFRKAKENCIFTRLL